MTEIQDLESKYHSISNVDVTFTKFTERQEFSLNKLHTILLLEYSQGSKQKDHRTAYKFSQLYQE